MSTSLKSLPFVIILLFSSSKLTAQQTLPDDAFEFIEEKGALKGTKKQDFETPIKTDGYISKGIGHTYYNQQWEGIPIHGKILSVTSQNDELIYASHGFIALDKFEKTPFLDALDPNIILNQMAKLAGLTYVGDFVETEIITEINVRGYASISSEKLFIQKAFVAKDSKLIPSWLVGFFHEEENKWWQYQINANTGLLIDKLSWTIECNFSHCSNHTIEDHYTTIVKRHKTNRSKALMANTYEVFPLGLLTPQEGDREIVVAPWNDALNASPFGWHDDNGIPGPEYTITRGNNVRAVEDTDNNNSGGFSPDGGSSLDFQFAMDYTDDPASYQSAAITNLFYFNNIMHDVWYQYGFDEPSGNFQENNYGNGGSASDFVNADAQDGSGTNNANFSTSPDGNNPRMQMYIWNISNSSTFDVTSPSNIAGRYFSQPAMFGPDTGGFFGTLVEASPIEACSPIANGSAINGNIAVINRGGCDFVDKVNEAQDVGAIAVIVCQNTTDDPFEMGGTDPSITIPSLMLSSADCDLIKTQLPGANVEFWFNDTGELDSDMDNGIIAHEYAHGISNRLTGGPSNTSCLSGSEQMGEGWSDYIGLVMTIKPGDVGNTPRGIGTYVQDENMTSNGIRTYPYTTDISINPHTYNDIKTAAVPHGVGSVWAEMLWEMTWILIDVHGYDPDMYNGTGGNNMAMNLVMEGMKNQPCNPGFVDGRDAILAADVALYGGANECLIWEAFAKRGLGVSAVQGTSNSRTDNEEAFDTPNSCLDLVSVTKTAQRFVGVSDNIQYSVVVGNFSGSTITNVVVTDDLPAEVNYVNGSLNMGTESGGVITVNDPTMLDNEQFTLTFEATPTGADSSDLEMYEDFEADFSEWLVSSDQGTGVFAFSSAQPYRGTGGFFVPNIGANNSQYLTIENVNLSANPFFSFYHSYDTEAGWDGGMFEVKPSSSSTWTDLGNGFVENGYNGTLGNGSNNDIDNRPAFTGTSNGYIRSWVDLSIFANQTVDIRFFFGSDNNTFETGWYIDEIMLYDALIAENEACLTSNEGDNVCGQVKTIILPDCELYNRYFADTDGDGFGDANTEILACSTSQGVVANDTDCNDMDVTIFPGAPEICDNIDNDCNDLVDDNCSSNGNPCDGVVINVNPVINAGYHARAVLNSDAIVPGNFILEFTAADTISLEPGFEVLPNTEFDAYLDECN